MVVLHNTVSKPAITLCVIRRIPMLSEQDSVYHTPKGINHLLFSCKGRINRKTYWKYSIVTFTIMSLIILIGIFGDVALALQMYGVVTLIFFYPGIAVCVKRFHDRIKSGWWCFITFVPCIGPWWLIIETGFLRGTEGDNKYGVQPP